VRARPKLVVVLVAVAMAAAGFVVFDGAALSARTSARPALRFVRIDPLIVRGLDFRSNEQVTLTARIPRAIRATHVTASAAGAFRVRLARVRSYDPCASTLYIPARGSLGSTASIRTLPRMCPVHQP
jgi:hypothetical protein